MKNVKANFPRERVTEWYKKGIPTNLIAKNLKVPYHKVYYLVESLRKKDKMDEPVFNDSDIIIDELIDMPEKINFQMKIYGISIRVTRVPSEIIFEDNYIEIN